VKGEGVRVKGSDFKAKGFGCRVQGLGIDGQHGLRFRARGSGFRV
jgi:hypothetical protein